MKKILFALFLTPLFLTCISGTAMAYTTIGGNCSDCHEYTIDTDWHNEHNGYAEEEYPDKACETCHTEDVGSEVPAASCTDCHDDLPGGWVGAHEENVEEGTCSACHQSEDSGDDDEDTDNNEDTDIVEGECSVTYLIGEGNQKLDTLRTLRDSAISSTATGQRVIKTYYAAGTDIICFLKQHSLISSMLRVTIRCITHFTDLLP
ncbi:MAG: cytochrome c3 family protein [Deltaproteobacteria bacterium]|nr:cytochrome c3 family protein [Deltaproteobacteria bacterium]